jgi:threonine/homoserine/homoserine lactone efflux protein
VTDPLAFSLAIVIVLATPGPTNTLLMTSGATVGIMRALPLLAAEALGYTVSILALGLSLAPFLAAWPDARTVVGVAVGTYLCWIAAKLWRRDIHAAGSSVSWRDVLITTLLNPKVFVFALVIIPFDSPAWARYMGGFVAIVVPVGLAWVTFGALTRRLMPDHRFALVPKVAAAVLLGFGLVLIGSAWRA